VSYDRQSWVDGESGGTPLSAARLAHMETGIGNAADEIAGRLSDAALRAAFASPWIDVDRQTGANDTAKMQAAIDAASAAIAAGGAPVEVRLSGRNYAWTGSIPKLPCNLAGKLRINGGGSKVTLSPSAAAFLEINKVADYDVFRNVDIFDVDIDANNVAGYGHAIIGTSTYSASAITTINRLSVDRIRVSRVTVTNLPTSWAGADFRAGVYLMAGLTGTAGEQAVSVTNVTCQDVKVNGGRFGIAIGARFTTSGRVLVDDCHIDRCYHDTGATPTNFLGCTNFFLGARAYGGYGSITNCHGRNSGDDGVEVNGLENVLVANCVIEDAANVAYLHNNFSPAKYAKSQKLTFRDCHARVVNFQSGSAAGMPGRGFLLNTKTVATTVAADAAIGASSIALVSATPNATDTDIFFPTRGTVAIGTQVISYTGLTGDTLTGVTGVTAPITAGTTATLINDVQSATFDGCTFYKQGQGYWEYLGDAFKVAGPIRSLTIRDFTYTALDWAASISAPATPAAFLIQCQPSEPGVDTMIRLDGIRIRMTGARTGGSTADWIAFDINGTSPFLTATGIEVDNAMTGMSAAQGIEGFRFGRAVNAATGSSYVGIIKGFKVKALGT
jgi:hypothetical protein